MTYALLAALAGVWLLVQGGGGLTGSPIRLLASVCDYGMVRPPSADGMTVGSPPSMTATTEFVVPRSMPMILPMSGVCSSPLGV